MRKLLIILYILCSITTLFAKEQKNTISGYVRTELGELMPFVDVYNADNKVFTVSDSVGKFSITTGQDTITLFFSHLGYVTEKLENWIYLE